MSRKNCVFSKSFQNFANSPLAPVLGVQKMASQYQWLRIHLRWELRRSLIQRHVDEVWLAADWEERQFFLNTLYNVPSSIHKASIRVFPWESGLFIFPRRYGIKTPLRREDNNRETAETEQQRHPTDWCSKQEDEKKRQRRRGEGGVDEEGGRGDEERGGKKM